MLNSKKKLGCVIMASGESKRFGKNKLVQLLNGQPLISFIINSCIESKIFTDIVVVTRWQEVVKIAESQKTFYILHNNSLVSDTIKLGSQYFSSKTDVPDGIMFCVADQPLILKETLKSLFNKFTKNSTNIIRLCKTDKETNKVQFANPVIFPKRFFAELETLPPDETGRFIIKNHSENVQYVEAINSFELLDADTVEDFHKIAYFIEKSNHN